MSNIARESALYGTGSLGDIQGKSVWLGLISGVVVVGCDGFDLLAPRLIESSNCFDLSRFTAGWLRMIRTPDRHLRSRERLIFLFNNLRMAEPKMFIKKGIVNYLLNTCQVRVHFK